MSLSLRTRRVALYAYDNSAAANGVVSNTYTKQASAAADGNWWASRGVPTGHEAMVGAQADHVADAVFGFADTVSVPAYGLVVDGTTVYRILAVLPRDVGAAETQVLAVTTDAARYTLSPPV